MKTCKKCGVEKPIEEFQRSTQNKDGHRGQCRECRRAYQNANYHTYRERILAKSKDWYWNNRDRALKKQRRVHLNARYGLTEAEYQRMFEEQSGVCAICHQPETHRIKGVLSSLVVDHDHETGAVRGLLCHDCNRGIGFLKDSELVMQSAISYLERSRQHGSRADRAA